MKWLTVFICCIMLGWLTGCRTPSPAERQNFVRGTRQIIPGTVKLANDLLELTIVPSSMGRISGISWKGEKISLFPEYTEWETAENPLFIQRSNRGGGVRELFWGTPMSSMALPMNLVKHSSDSMIFETDFYGNSEISLQRRIVLKAGTSVIEFTSEFQSRGKRRQRYALWLSLCPSQPMVPQIVLKNTSEHREQVAPGWKRQERFPVVCPWIGGYLPEAGSMLVFAAAPEEFQPDGFFYSWKNYQPKNSIHTMEPVFARRTLAFGEKCVHRWRLMVFKGIRRLRALRGCQAFDAEQVPGGLKLTMASAVPSSAEKGVLHLRRKNQALQKIAFEMPACAAGRAVSVLLPVSDDTSAETELFLQFGQNMLKLIAPADSAL